MRRYQGPNGSSFHWLPYHQEEQNQRRPMSLSGMTEEEYSKGYQILIQQVNAERMLPYFENMVFFRTFKKFIVPDIGYDGVIGLRPVGWKQTKDIEEWIPESSSEEHNLQALTPDDVDTVIARSENLEQMEPEPEHEEERESAAVAVDKDAVGINIAQSGNTCNMDVDMDDTKADSINSVDIAAQEDLQALHAMAEDEHEDSLVLEGESFDSGEGQEEDEQEEDEQRAPTTDHSLEPHIIETEADKKKGTVDNCRKACIYLWKLQIQRTTKCPNPAPNPRSDRRLDDAINTYGDRLVYNKVTTGTARNTACDKLIRMATYTWQQQPVRRAKGVRKYSCITRFPYIRERLCILARHHMLLRDEDIRNLNLSDVFATLQCQNAKGSRWARGLTFRYEIDKETPPDFSDEDKWKGIKLLVANNVLSVPDVDVCLIRNSAAQIKAKLEHELAQEKQDKIPNDELLFTPEPNQRGIRYGTLYGTDEPYILQRDLVPPPPELQTMLFGWIEHVFDGHDYSIVEAWHMTCMEEMIGFDLDEACKGDIFFEGKTAARSGLEQSAQTDKIAFLKLMVRMRRVIIQDAVVCLQPVPRTARTLSNRLIEKLPAMFQSPLFLDYSKELLQAIERHIETSAAIAVGVHADGPAIIEDINRSASQETIFKRALATMEAKHRKQLKEQDERHAKAMAAQITQYNQLHEAHKDILSCLQEFRAIQQLLVQHSKPHPHHQPQHPPQHLQSTPYHAPQQEPQVPSDFIMHPDRGAWTLRDDWNEYHGPLARAYADSYKTWAANQRKQYRPRVELIELIRKKATREGRSIDSILDSVEYEKMGLNRAKKLLKTDFGDTGITALVEALKANSTAVTTMDLTNNQIGQVGTQVLAEALMTNQTLIALNLKSNFIGEAGARSFAIALEINRTLADLNLCSNEIDDAGACSLAKVLETNHAVLISLNLSRNLICNHGVLSLTLNLKGNEFGDITVQAIADALKCNQTLATLDFRYNAITSDGA
ncbi:hypothetical protein BG004_003464 [Podila humilis]|nr:hypothetical protein BG004_003464 [Podila humilis]